MLSAFILSSCTSVVYFKSSNKLPEQVGNYYVEEGLASYYSDQFMGKITASGEAYNPNYLTAAHRTLPFGTLIKVVNIENGKEVLVRVNDRGPFVEGRIVDLSKKAAKSIGIFEKGLARVRIEVVE